MGPRSPAEAKSAGFDVAALDQIIKLRKQDKGERDERQARHIQDTEPVPHADTPDF